MKIGIVTDSTCGLEKDILKKLKVRVVSLYIQKGGEYYKATEIDKKTYYEELENAKILPMTSQPSPQDFYEVFRELSTEYDALIVPVISAKLSGTFDSASIAASMLDINIRIVDSKLTNYALGFLVMNLKSMIDQGKSLDELVKYAEEFHKNIRLYLSVGSLNYLYKGGRIAKAKTLMGNILNVKPVIAVENGELVPVGSVRGNKRLLAELIKRATTPMAGKEIKRIAILLVNREDDAKYLEEILAERFKGAEIFITEPEPVVVTHLGPSAIALITEWREKERY